MPLERISRECASFLHSIGRTADGKKRKGAILPSTVRVFIDQHARANIFSALFAIKLLVAKYKLSYKKLGFHGDRITVEGLTEKVARRKTA